MAEPVSAGMDPYKLMAFTRQFRGTNEDREPIVIAPIPGTEFFRISDGRHRFIASVMAGRKDVLAIIEEPKTV
jgi:hypothetical protein